MAAGLLHAASDRVTAVLRRLRWWVFTRPTAATVQQITALKEERSRLNVDYVEAPSAR